MKSGLISFLRVGPFSILRALKLFFLERIYFGNPHLFVDVTELAKRDSASGIQRVTRAICSELLGNPPCGFTVELVRFERESNTYCFARKCKSSLFGTHSTSFADPRIRFRKGDVFLALDLSPISIENAVPQLIRMRRSGVRLAYVVYDILPLRHPEWWDKDIFPIMYCWARLVAQHADIALAISRATIDDYELWLYEQNINSKISLRWFHLGADIRSSVPSTGFQVASKDVLQWMTLNPSFLMVGTVEPRKGHLQVLRAFEILWNEGLNVNLVVVGKPGWCVENLTNILRSHKERGNRLLWLDDASDEYLEEIYTRCDALLAASEGEGFGLPLIEAASHGMRIIARDLAVFREVAGEDAKYFSGKDPEDVASVIRQWIRFPSSRPPIPTFRWLTWRESTDQMLAAIGLRRRQGVS